MSLKLLVAPIEIVSTNGRAEAVQCRRMALGGFDRSGRRRPEAMLDEDGFVLEADQVIAAIGQKIVPEEVLNGTAMALTERGFLKADLGTGQTSVDWLFAGGDAAEGPSSVAKAVGAGERAAVGIDAFLTGESHAFWREDKMLDTDFDPDADPVECPRARMRLIPVEKRRHNFDEVEKPFTETVAIREAHRCLRCDFRQ